VTTSIFDPKMEFLEIGVSLNGAKAWKVYGPDLNGRYGGLQGTGGLEATIVDASKATKGVINDNFGNGVASVASSSVTWFTTKVGGYGPLPDVAAESFTDITRVAEATAWRSRRIDPTGFYYLGARYYEPTSGRFLSVDPLGHAASRSLYDFCNGDPVNYFDADGRFAGTPLSAGEYFGAVGSGLWTGAGNVGCAAVTAPYRFGQTVVSGYSQMGGLLGDVLTGNSGIVDMASHPINTLQASGSVAVNTAVDMGKGIYQQAQTSEGLATLSTDLAFGLAFGKIVPAANTAFESPSTTAKYLEQGFTQAQADYLAQRYEGMGEHFLKRAWLDDRGLGLPNSVVDNIYNVLTETA